MHAKSLQSCPILWDPMDCSLPDSSVHDIFQVRILEWVAMPSSQGSSQPRYRTCIYVSWIGRSVPYHWCHLGSPHIIHTAYQLGVLSTNDTECVHSCHVTVGFPKKHSLQWLHEIFEWRQGLTLLPSNFSAPLLPWYKRQPCHWWNTHF